ncbi:MAG: GNAT family N-acetyltransferase [Firmicutes bacterium]|nr:GNAT family N-acetyltransferase [Bacillota bacterium]MDD4264582.1 GNAT family N-acetyltransferase [Bacillota bacterium]MDD4694341.1 GNAT family N-acetyltransferase [Bacillota bacterium]
MINVSRNKQSTRVEFIKDEQPISWLIINHLKIYVWGKEFTCGGIGGVGTKEEFRKKGYSKAVLDKSLEVMREQDYDFSLLFGIPNYYYRWGFASCFPQNRVEIATFQAERATLTHEVEKLLPEHFPRLVEIYNQNNATRTGSVLRDPKEFTKLRVGSHFGIRASGYVFKRDGQIEGYLILDELDRRVNASEIGGINPSVYYSALAFLATKAIEKRVENVSANLPLDHPFALIAREFAATVSANYIYNADGMGRIINQESVLKAIEEDLFKNSNIDPQKTSLLFKTDLENTQIGSGKKVVEISLDQKSLTQLIFGYRDAASLNYEGKLSSDLEIETLALMFPHRISHLSGPDKF